MKSESAENRNQKKQSNKSKQNHSNSHLQDGDPKREFALTERLMSSGPTKPEADVGKLSGSGANCDGKELPLTTRLKMYALLLSVLYLALHYRQHDPNNGLWFNVRIKGNLWPLERLLNYEKFKERYPRIRSNQYKRLSEHSRRFLIFNQDLISIGKHNMAYILGKHSYYMRQSPFKSDRTKLEQMDVLNQLDEFNLAQILEASRMLDQTGQPVAPPKNAESINFKSPYVKEKEIGKLKSSFFSSSSLDKPVRGHQSSKSSVAELEKSNHLNRWFNRLVQGDSFFEIPNFPLDQQPNPAKITHIDSDLRSCSDEIRDQGSCGACYAFSWLSYVEWHYCKQSGGNKLEFSPQHIVDCGYKAKLGGCTEGLLKNTQAFSQVYGLELEKNYPYKRKEGLCKREQGEFQIKSKLTRIKVDRGEWEKVLMEQPILLEVHLPADVLSYSRGVHPGLNCDHNLGHGMILVGYGSQDGVPYWLLKNSMGRKWGENGYLRLSREAPMNQCFATGFIAKIKFKSLSDEAYDNFYDSLEFEPTVQPEESRVVDKNAKETIQKLNDF